MIGFDQSETCSIGAVDGAPPNIEIIGPRFPAARDQRAEEHRAAVRRDIVIHVRTPPLLRGIAIQMRHQGNRVALGDTRGIQLQREEMAPLAVDPGIDVTDV